MVDSAASHSFVQRLAVIIKVSRPAGWCFGPILFGIGLIHSGHIPKSLPLLISAGVQVFSLSFPLCIVVFGINDVYDYESDIRNPRKIQDGLEGTVLNPTYHTDVRIAAWISTGIVILSAIMTRRSQNVVATTFLVILGWQYSAPPLRLKEIPIIDSLSNGLIVFLSWFLGYSFGGDSITTAPEKGYVLSLCTAGVHALGAAIDAEVDAAAGQRTVATTFGKKGAIMLGAAAYLSAYIAERDFSIFGVYILGGLMIMLGAFLKVSWADVAFRMIVYWTVGMSMVWFGNKIMSMAASTRGRTD